MNRILRISTAALFGATIIASPAFAQMDDGNANATESSNPSNTAPMDQEKVLEPEANVDTGMTAAVEPDFDSAVGMIGAAGSADAVAGATEIGEVRVVSLSTLPKAEESRMIEAMSKGEAEINALHTAIDGNAALKSQLESQSVMTTDVVAADVAANGEVVVYTR